MDTAKLRVRNAVDARSEALIDVSRQIHGNPELGFEEHFAHDLLTGLLEEAGFHVERSAFGLDTAFVATAGESGPTIAVMCEYDALPEIGHGCGHNVIAAAGLGAALAAKQVAEQLGGRLMVLGTPAEEGGGGKILLADRGALQDVDAAMMVHPAARDLTRMDVVAIERLHVDYHGEAAHAAAAPHRGRNALDAAVLGYVNIAALRQHLGHGERVHGIITDGGSRPNIVPAHAAAEWYVRSRRRSSLSPLVERVFTCLQAGTSAAQCTMTHQSIGPVYDDMVHNQAMVQLYVDNAATLGRTVLAPAVETAVVGSTDMGNVSYRTPSIHPMIKIAPAGVPLHSVEFARHAGSPSGDLAALDGAKAMAMTIVDLWERPDVLRQARAEFEDGVTNGPLVGSTHQGGGEPPSR
ncbi:MAG: M20 family metallopeptidase [Ilumatobacteraceae bacterium]